MILWPAITQLIENGPCTEQNEQHLDQSDQLIEQSDKQTKWQADEVKSKQSDKERDKQGKWSENEFDKCAMWQAGNLTNRVLN